MDEQKEAATTANSDGMTIQKKDGTASITVIAAIDMTILEKQLEALLDAVKKVNSLAKRRST